MRKAERGEGARALFPDEPMVAGQRAKVAEVYRVALTPAGQPKGKRRVTIEVWAERIADDPANKFRLDVLDAASGEQEAAESFADWQEVLLASMYLVRATIAETIERERAAGNTPAFVRATVRTNSGQRVTYTTQL